MRQLAFLPLALLISACWTPGPGELDPTRYPWDQPRPRASYCIVSLETPSSTGITLGGGHSVQLGCDPPSKLMTKPECHGDHAVLKPGEVEYPC